MSLKLCLEISQRVLLLFIVAVLLSTTGCVTNERLRKQDVGEMAWLRSLPESFDGFFVAEDGRLLLINIYSMTGDRWLLQEEQLVLWTYTERYREPQPIAYRGRLEGERLVLLPAKGNDSLIYTSSKVAGPISGSPYSPVYLKNSRGLKLPTEQAAIYLQFNAAEGTVRGFGGVNNFKANYQRSGNIGFKSGPLMSTKMAGPGMDYEMLLLSCLDHADTFISLRNMLFFYQDKELLGSFIAK